MSSESYAKTVGGKLKLKGGLSLSAALKAAGVKRPREDVPSIPLPTAASSSSSSSSTSSSSAAASSPAPAQRIQGKGRLISSGVTLHGTDTDFLEDLAIGDAIQLTNPVSGKDEIRVVKMVLSKTSAGVNAPFSSDLVTGTSFHVLKLPKATIDPAAIAAQAAEEARKQERAAFGTYGEGAGKMTYLVKKGGTFKGYEKVTETVGALSREDMLERRAKHKSDKFC